LFKHSEIYISKWGIGLPSRSWSNEDITQAFDLNMRSSTIEKMIGIKERRWADENWAASDLGVLALKEADITNESDALWVSTISSDYWTPSTSSLVKKKMGWKNFSPSYDINASCSGLIFALEAASFRMSAAQEKSAVVVATEMRSRFVNPKDRNTVYLFGDGAVAFELNKKSKNSQAQVMWTKTVSIPAEAIDIGVLGGGSARPLTAKEIEKGSQYIQILNGNQVEEKVLGHLVGLIREVLSVGQISIADFNFFVFHQANQALLNKLMKELEIPEGRFYSSFEKYGNTSSSSLGINLVESHQKGLIKTGDRVLCLSMGAGDHFGMMELKIMNSYPGEEDL